MLYNKYKKMTLTVAEVAEILGVNPVTVRTMINEGKLNAIQLGSNNSKKLINLKDVARMLEGE